MRPPNTPLSYVRLHVHQTSKSANSTSSLILENYNFWLKSFTMSTSPTTGWSICLSVSSPLMRLCATIQFGYSDCVLVTNVTKERFTWNDSPQSSWYGSRSMFVTSSWNDTYRFHLLPRPIADCLAKEKISVWMNDPAFSFFYESCGLRMAFRVAGCCYQIIMHPLQNCSIKAAVTLRHL